MAKKLKFRDKGESGTKQADETLSGSLFESTLDERRKVVWGLCFPAAGSVSSFISCDYGYL